MFLSKSDYMMALDCAKALWLKKNRKDLIPPTPQELQAIFDKGNETQDLARDFFDGGYMVEADYWNITGGCLITQEQSKKHDILFEAFAKTTWGAYCRIDVMQRNSNGWDLIEIKATNEAKSEHYVDLAFQRYVFMQAGYPIKSCYVLHFNKEYKKDGKIDVKQLFTLTDVSEQVEYEYHDVQKKALEFYKIQKGKSEPKIELHKACKGCQFYHYCGKDIPEFSLFDVIRNPKADKLYIQRKSAEITPDILPECSDAAKVAVQAFIDNKEYVDKDRIKEFLDTLEYPLYYLDYETIQPAIPLFDNSGTYNQIPFQFSLHIQKEKGGTLEHIEFLHKEKSDPRRLFAEKLVDSCGKKGSVIVYNQAFEETRNKELANLFPDLNSDILSINARMIDLLKPFRDRVLYNPKQQNSNSIKYVLPAFTDLSYDDMEIANGGEAMDRYLSFMQNKLSEEEEQTLFSGLTQYCHQDTLAMAKLIDVLYSKI